MAEPDTRDELFQLLLDGKISHQQFHEAVQSGVPADPAEQPPPELRPYIPPAAPVTAQRELIYQRAAAETREGMPAREATRQALESVDPVALEKATTEYGRSAAGGVGPSAASLIRDVEKGMVYDPELRTYRKGSRGELLYESFFPQILAGGEEFEAMARWLETDLPEEAPLEEKAIHYIAPHLMTPSHETGQMVETPLGTGLRALGSFPAAVAATAQPITGTQESDEYRLADSGEWADQVIVNIAKGQGMPQLFESSPVIGERYSPKTLAATGSTSPQFGVAFAVWSLMDLDIPFWAGMATEFYMPATGIIAVPRSVSRLASAGGRQVAKAAPKAGEAIAAASSPLRYAKYKKTERLIDEIADTAKTGASAADLRKIADSAPWTSPERWDRHLDGSSLKDVAADSFGTHITDVVWMDEMAKAGQLDDTLILNRPPSALKARLLSRPANVTPANHYRTILKSSRDAITDAGGLNPMMARLINQAEAGAEMSVALGKGKVAKRGAGRLGMQIQDNLFSVRLAKSAGTMSRKTFQTVLKRVASEKGKPFDLANYPELGAASVDDILDATTKAVSENAKTSVLNMLPENLTVISGSVVAPRKSLENIAKLEAWQRALSDKFARFRYDAARDLHRISSRIVREDIAKIVVAEAGAATIRRSKTLQETLSNLLKGKLTTAERMFVEKHLKGHYAKQYLDAFDLRYGGEQLKRAIIPDELAYGVTDLSLKKGDRGHLFLTTRDIVSAVRIVANDKIPWFGVTPKKFLKTVEDIEVSPEFFAFERRVNDELASVMPRFKEELKQAEKQFPDDPVQGFNSVAMNVWDDLARKTTAREDQFVLDNLNGNWKKYIRFMLPKREVQIERHVANRMRAGATNEEAVRRQVVLDFKLFEDKADSWDSILSAYYGSFVDEKGTSISYIEHFVKKGIHNISLTGAIRRRDVLIWVDQSAASNVLDFSVDNFALIRKRIEAKVPEMRGKGLKHLIKRDEAPLPAMMDWMLGQRRGLIFSRLFDDFIDSNPQYAIDFAPTPNSMYAQLDLPAVETSYLRFFNDISRSIGAPTTRDIRQAIDDLTKKIQTRLNAYLTAAQRLRISFADLKKQVLADQVINGWNADRQALSKKTDIVSRLAQLHIEAVQKTTASVRRDLIGKINEKIINQRTMRPKLDSLKESFRYDLELPFADLAQRAKDFIVAQPEFKALSARKQRTELNKLNTKLFNLYTGLKGPDTLFDAPIVTALNDMLYHLQQAYRNHGLALGDDLINTMTRGAVSTAPSSGSRSMVLTLTEAAQLDNMLKLTRTTRLSATLDHLHAADKGVGKWAFSVLGSGWTAGRRMITSGLLAGFPFPNPRYLGQNILTAPAIIATTLGLRRMGLSSKHITDSLAFVGNGKPDKTVLFTSDLGRAWTKGELKQVLARTNIGFTRGDVEFSEVIADEALKNVRLSIGGKKVGKWSAKNLERTIAPWKKNVWQIFADGSDNMFRRAVFFSGLKEGKTVEASAELAQRALLDYGKMSQIEKKYMGNVTLFWAFRRQMMLETVNSLYRATVKGEGPGVVVSTVRASMRQQQEMETWFYGQDEGKKRFYAMFKGDFDRMDYARYGPANPSVEVFETSINVFTLLFSMMKGEQQNHMLDLLQEVQFLPIIDHILEGMEDREGARPPKVPADFVWMIRAFGVEEYWSDVFNFKNDVHREYAGSPSFGPEGQQPRFGTNKDARNFAWLQLAFTYLGISRNLSEYSKWAMTADVQPKGGAELKRFAEPHPLLYPLTLDTSLPVTDPVRQKAMKRKTIERRLEAILREEDIYKD